MTLTLGDAASVVVRVIEADPSRVARMRALLVADDHGARVRSEPLGPGVTVTQIVIDDSSPHPRTVLWNEVERAEALRPDLPAPAAYLARADAVEIGPGIASALLEIDGLEDPLFMDVDSQRAVPGADTFDGGTLTAREALVEATRPIDEAQWSSWIRGRLAERGAGSSDAEVSAVFDAWTREAAPLLAAFAAALRPIAERDGLLLVWME